MSARKSYVYNEVAPHSQRTPIRYLIEIFKTTWAARRIKTQTQKILKINQTFFYKRMADYKFINPIFLFL